MAARYARAGGGDWTTDATWSTTSGGAADTVAPTAADDVYLDASSGNVTTTSGSVGRSIDCTGYTGTLTLTSAISFGDGTAGAGNIALKFVAGMTISGTAVITFVSTSSTQQSVDFAGKTTGNVVFNATSNGSWQYTGGHTCGSSNAVVLTKGSLDINGQTCSWGQLDSNNSNVRSLTLGAADITLTIGGTSALTFSTATNMSFSGASSTITFSGTNSTITPGTGGFTFGTINMTGAGQAQINNTFTCATFTRTGTAAKTDSLNLIGTANLTVTSALNINGNSSVNRILFFCANAVGSQRTVTTTGATVTCTNTDFKDIRLTVTKDFSAQSDIGDCGGNGGITFPASTTQTATMSTNKNWDDATIWTSRVPLPQDDVSGAGITGGQLATNGMPRLGRSIDFTGATGSPTFALNIQAVSIFGSLTLISGMTFSGTNGFTFEGRSSFDIVSAGKTFAGSVVFTAPTGTYNLIDALTTSGQWTLNNGTFVSNNLSVTALAFNINGTATRALTMGTSTFTATSTATTNVFIIVSVTGLTFSGASSTIVISATSANTRTLQGAGQTFGTLTYTVAGSTGTLNITGANTFSVINFSDASNARSLRFTAGTTTTVGTFNVNGTASKLMSVTSITGAAFTMTSSNQQSCDYLNLTNSVVDATPKWYAGANSTDGTGNTNWIFTAAPANTTYTSLAAAESDWYITRSGKPVNSPLNEHKRAYWRSKGIVENTQGVNEAEKTWLRSVASSSSNSLPELWRQAVAAQSLPVSNGLNANKFTFYSSVTTSP